MLNTRDALELYTVLLPIKKLVSFKDSGINIIKQIISLNGEIFIKMLCIFTGKSRDDVIKMERYEAINLFSEGLLENNIPSLIQFWETLGYD